MLTRTPAFAGLMLAWAAAASAQSWQDAYDRQDYPTAAAQLQSIVFEHPQGTSRYPNPQAIQTLAQLYAEGRGVAKDPLTACALSNLGSGAAVYRHGERDARTIAIQRQVDWYCVPLTRRNAGRSWTLTAASNKDPHRSFSWPRRPGASRSLSRA